MEAVGRAKTLIIRCRGCKNRVFCYIGFFVILGTIWEVILEPKMEPKSHYDRLWASIVAILSLMWDDRSNDEKSIKSRVSRTGVGGRVARYVATW